MTRPSIRPMGCCLKLIAQGQRAKLEIKQAIRSASGATMSLCQEKLVDAGAVNKVQDICDYLEEHTLEADKDD